MEMANSNMDFFVLQETFRAHFYLLYRSGRARRSARTDWLILGSHESHAANPRRRALSFRICHVPSRSAEDETVAASQLRPTASTVGGIYCI